MCNNLERDESRRKEINDRFDTAKKNGDNIGMEKACQDMRSFISEIKAKGDDYAYVFRLYQEMKEAGNNYVDLNNVNDEVKVLNRLRACGIERFTFSSTWSSAVESAWIFQQNGCVLEGLIEINSQYTQWPSRKRQKAHGYLFKIQ